MDTTDRALKLADSSLGLSFESQVPVFGRRAHSVLEDSFHFPEFARHSIPRARLHLFLLELIGGFGGFAHFDDSLTLGAPLSYIETYNTAGNQP